MSDRAPAKAGAQSTVAALVALGNRLRGRARLILPPYLPSCSWHSFASPCRPHFQPARVIAAWQPSEAWLYDRTGALIDSAAGRFRGAAAGLDAARRDRPSGAGDTVIAGEDKRFRGHGGIDWLAARGGAAGAAIGRPGARAPRPSRCRSPPFLAPDLARPGARRWRDKLRQMRAGMALESRAGRRTQILEAYLNLAGFRGEAQGIGAAALAAVRQDRRRAQPRRCAAARGAAARSGCRRVPQVAGGLAGCVRTPGLRASACDGGRDAAAPRAAALDPGLAPHLAGRLLTEPGLNDRPPRSTPVSSRSRPRRSVASSRDWAAAARATARWWWSTMRPGTCWLMSAGSAALRRAGGRRCECLSPGRIDAEAVPLRAGDREGLSDRRLDPRRFAGPARHRLGPLCAAELRPGVQGAGHPRARAGGIAQRAGGAHLAARRGRGVSRPAVGYRLSRADRGRRIITVSAWRSARPRSRCSNRRRPIAVSPLGGRWAPLRLRRADPQHALRRGTSARGGVAGRRHAWPIRGPRGTFGLDSALRLPFWAAVKTGTSKAMRDNWCVRTPTASPSRSGSAISRAIR